MTTDQCVSLTAATLTCAAVQGVQLSSSPVESPFQGLPAANERLAQILEVYRGISGQLREAGDCGLAGHSGYSQLSPAQQEEVRGLLGDDTVPPMPSMKQPLMDITEGTSDSPALSTPGQPSRPSLRQLEDQLSQVLAGVCTAPGTPMNVADPQVEAELGQVVRVLKDAKVRLAAARKRAEEVAGG